MIPARFASTRFPGKPLIPILGKTLLQRTYENTLRASTLDKVIVATDDQRIFDHVVNFGGEAIMTSDCLTGTDRLAEVLQLRPEFLKASVIVNIQGDEPCIDPSDINKVANLLLNDPEAAMATVATHIHTEEEARNPSIVKCIVDQNKNAIYFSRALIPANKKLNYDPKFPYLRHIGLYAYRPDFILAYQKLKPTPLQLAEDLEQLKILEHGYRIKLDLIKHASPGVDTPEDIKKVELWIYQNTSL